MYAVVLVCAVVLLLVVGCGGQSHDEFCLAHPHAVTCHSEAWQGPKFVPPPTSTWGDDPWLP